MWEHRAEMTTATTEDAAQVIESTRHYNGSRSFIVPADAARALMDAGLLASSSPARTRPTREQIAEAIHAVTCGFADCTYGWADEQAADAVLALLTDQPTEAEAGARALLDFADATRFPSDWILFRRDDGTGVTVSDLLRETAARLRGGADQ